MRMESWHKGSIWLQYCKHYDAGQSDHLRFVPLLNEVLGRKVIPVMYLNELGPSFDRLLNLGFIEFSR
jgi:hypothetical protein